MENLKHAYLEKHRCYSTTCLFLNQKFDYMNTLKLIVATQFRRYIRLTIMTTGFTVTKSFFVSLMILTTCVIIYN